MIGAAVVALSIANSPSATADGQPPESARGHASPELVDDGMDDLLTAPVPALCRHAAGRLHDGALPIADPGAGYGRLAFGEPGLGPVLTDLTGDGDRDAAVVFRCSAGGVAWPDTVLFYGPGATLLGAADLSTVTNDVDVEHATVSSIAADGTDVAVRWTTTRGCCFNPRSWSARLHWDGRAVRILGAQRA